MMSDAVVDVSVKNASTLRRERLDFMRDRVGGNGNHRIASRITYLAHAKGWVMARHPGCIPFVVTEKDWRSFPYWEKPAANEQIPTGDNR